MRAIFSGVVAVLLAGCVSEPPDGLWNPLPVVEAGSFRFQGISEEHARWYQARYADFTSEFGVALQPGELILIAPGNHGPAECLPTYLPGSIEIHPCSFPGGYKLICDGDRQCPLRFAELLVNLTAPRSDFLRDGLADIIAGGVTTPSPFDFEFEEYESRVHVFIDNIEYAAEIRRLQELYTRDWYRSVALRASLRRTAARFVAFLVGRVGPRGVVDLFRLPPADWSQPVTRQLIDDFAAAPPTDGRSHARLAVECATPVLPLSTDLSIDVTEGAPIYDATAPPSSHRQARTFEVSEPSRLHLRFESSGLPYYHLQSCATGISLRHVEDRDLFSLGKASPEVAEQVDLPPGRYVLILGVMTSALSGPDTVSARLDLTPIPP